MATQPGRTNEMAAEAHPARLPYLHSRPSVGHIARMLKMETGQAMEMVDDLIREYAAAEIHGHADMPVGKVMQRDVATLDVSNSALDAATMMIQKGVGYVLVTYKGKPYGMVTEKDILCEMAVFGKALAGLSLEVISSRPLVRVSPRETVRDVVDLMEKNSIKSIPVVRNGTVLGMVVAGDIVRLLSSAKRQE